MQNIIEKLERTIEELEVRPLDCWNDGFTYAVAFRHYKGIFVVYTTKSISHYNEEKPLRIFQAKKGDFRPFNSVTPWPGGDFIMAYMYTLIDEGKCHAIYHDVYSVKDIPYFLERAAQV